MRKIIVLTLLSIVGCTATHPNPTTKALSPTISLATYNIELFAENFRGFHMEKAAATQPADPALHDAIPFIKRMNDKSQWAAAQVITDPAFAPDILCVEEGPDQSDLDFFNQKWLHSMYATVIVFPTNSTRHQSVDMLLKPGFTVLERRDQYYQEKDSVGNARGESLFARGPAFLLVKAPSGYTFWVGVTHQKSKYGNSLEVAQWRNREAKRTHAILNELRATNVHDVILLGDMNDDLGTDEYESDPSSGGDAIANLVGPPSEHFLLATRKLADQHAISYHGYFNPKYRSLIDHAVLSPEMAPRLQSTQVFHNDYTQVASDHYPVLVKIEASPR